LSDKERVLSQKAAQAYYDRFGKKQDSQSFYENPALDDLIAHAGFQDIQSVFEFGCGTGKLATRLLENHLPSSASYLGCDISPVMVGIAKRRVAAYGERAQVTLTDGAIRFPCSDHSVDRVVSTYVLDLLPESDIRRYFKEAGRALVPGGELCLASLTSGVNFLSRIVSSLWMGVFRLHPAIVGGCRPIRLDSFVNPEEWRVVHKRVVTPFGVPSEVLISASRGKSGT
jgi:ubiquinone/menaquinone biosynthesis C-methylase UbiE